MLNSMAANTMAVLSGIHSLLLIDEPLELRAPPLSISMHKTGHHLRVFVVDIILSTITCTSFLTLNPAFITFSHR